MSSFREQLRVLKECNIESFYQRCLPIGVGLGVGTYFAIQRGLMKSSARFGAFPKVALAGTLGYFIGKFSYRQKVINQLINSFEIKIYLLLF